MASPALQVLLPAPCHDSSASSAELHCSSQACYLLSILRYYIRQHCVFARGNLLRQLHIFRQLGCTLLDRALEINVLDCIAQVRILLNDRDKAVLDLKVDFSAVLDVFREVAFSGDLEGGAAVMLISGKR